MTQVQPTTNRQRRARLAELREVIATASLWDHDEGCPVEPDCDVAFDMDNWFAPSECGTAACVAGHAVLLPSFKKAGGARLRSGPVKFRYGEREHPEHCAGPFLGLTRDEDYALFFQWDDEAAKETVRDTKVRELDALIASTPDDDELSAGEVERAK